MTEKSRPIDMLDLAQNVFVFEKKKWEKGEKFLCHQHLFSFSLFHPLP